MFVDAALTLDSHCRTSFPSGVSVSADGQILVLSHAFLHILTPALGLSLRTDRSCLHGFPGNKTPDQWERERLADLLEAGECQGLEFFKTSIEVQKAEVHWEEWTNDLRQTTPGGLDNGWRMATWSPSGLSDLGGCILATLTVNREVHIFKPHNDPVKATWNEAIDITSIILQSLVDEQPDLLNIQHASLSQVDRRRKETLVLQAQATSISWSFALPTFPTQDDSLLAISHRSGQISFWRYDGQESMIKLAQFKATDSGALLMAWTSWLQQTDPNTQNTWYDAWLAIGCATGQIKIIRITVSADSSVSVVEQHACLPSQKTVTLLKWLKTGQLVVGRLGEVVVWSPGPVHFFKLPIENYRGWPTIPNPIEVIHITSEDRLVIGLSDGTFRSIDNLSTAPQLSTISKSSSPTALQLSEGARRGFLAVEKAAAKNKATITPTTAMILAGVPSLDESGTVVLSYEKHHLDIKTFQASTYHKQSLLLGRLSAIPGERTSEQIATALQSEIRNLINVHEMCGVANSSKPLFPLFLSINRSARVDGVSLAILDCLRSVIPLSLPIPPELVMKADLSAFLLKDKSLHVLRLISLMLAFCANALALGELQEEFLHLSNQIVKQIYIQVFSAWLRILQAESLTDNTLYTRYQRIIEQLSAPVQQHMELDGISEARPVEAFETEIDELDRCAACSEVIGFDKLGRATCRNGHEWLRCSVTLAVLSTSAARTCMVCSRKTRVPIASDFQVDEAETASQLLLRVSRCCLFCGGRWTRGY